MAIHQEGSDKCFVFVDHSNIWIGGKAARAKHYENAESQDSRFRIEYRRLIPTVLKGRELVCGFCCGPNLLQNKPNLKNFCYSEQTIEGLMYETMYKNKNVVFIVITGNEAVVPAIEEALECGIPVELWSWEHSASEILKIEFPTFSSCFLDELPLEKIGFTAYKYNKPIDEEHAIECVVPQGKLPLEEILNYFDNKKFLIYIRSYTVPGDEKHQLLKIEIPDVDPQEILGKPRDFKYEFTEIKDPQPLSPVDVKKIIEEAMAKEKIKTEDIIESDVNYENSKQFFKLKGYAKFYCPNKHYWYSSYSQCVLDLKTQAIRPYNQKCIKCQLTAEPRFQRGAVKSMATNAVRMYLTRTSQVHDENNLCKACKELRNLCSEHDSESWNYCSNIEKHLQISGAIDRYLAHLVFVGLPGSGKTTLIARLLNLKEVEEMLKACASTGIMNGIIPVNLKEDIACLHAVDADEANCTWRKVELSLSCLGQMGSSLKSDLPESIDNEIVILQENSTDTKGATEFKKEAIVRASKFKMADVDKVLEKDGFSAVRPFLDKKSTLYLSDTGGQIEFQELLPLLMARLAIFIFLFRLDVDINEPIKICYRKKEGTEVEFLNVYTSSLTTAESFLQTLASIDAMDTTTSRFTSKHRPIVFVVGTHKDCLIKEIGDSGAEEKIAEIDDKMKSLIRRHKYDDLVVYADHSKDEVLFAVDNTCDNDIFQKIRSNIMRQIHSSDKFRIQFPLSYLLASLHLQDNTNPIIKRSDFVTNVKQYGILEEDVDYLLQFLHSRIGQIRYFPLEDIKEIIVNEPQTLYNLVTDLIIMSFISDRTMKETSEVQRGIYSLESFHTNNSSEISPLQIINLLKELRIVAPFTDQKSKEDKYFIPCVLNHLEEPADDTCEPYTIQPLAITFESGHCPKGLFGVLLHYILTHKNRQLEWNLIIKSIFRDQVSFQVGPYEDTVTIKFHTTYLDIRCIPIEAPTCDVSLQNICNTIRSTLESGIEQATDILHYSREKTRHHVGLICRECGNPHKVKVDTYRDSDHLIKCNSKWLSMPSQGAYWFGVPPTYSFNDSNEVIFKEGENGSLRFTVKSELPIEKHTLFRDGSKISENCHVYIKDSTIFFRNIKKSNEGKYIIASSNSAGSGNATFIVKVKCPPKYHLDSPYKIAEAGSSFSLKFSIDSDPSLDDGTKHTLTRSDGRQVTKRFSVEGYCINFCNVKVEDSGMYTISCYNEEGERGEEEFELEITPYRSPAANTVYPTELSEKDIYTKLSPYSSRWMSIGRNLGFTHDELSNIKAMPTLFLDAPDSYLSHMLSDWLKWAPGDARGSKGYATIKALNEAVDRAGLGRAAQELL